MMLQNLMRFKEEYKNVNKMFPNVNSSNFLLTKLTGQTALYNDNRR